MRKGRPILKPHSLHLLHMNFMTPKFSIITIVYNSKDVLEGTILSVINQSYTNIEYIIVDGASNDGTIDTIKKYEGKIQKWISEPDKGLYDAMNKGIDMASGDYLWFMNAGDRIFESSTLEKIATKAIDNPDILFGEVMLVNDQRSHIGTRSEITTQKLPRKLNWKSLKKGMVVCHQGFLPKRSITSQYILGNISADIDWVINCLKKAKTIKNTDLVLAEYLQGGLSKKQHRKALWNRYEVLKKHYGWLPNLWNHFQIIIRAAFNNLMRIGKPKY